jgi:hypothetical protein
LGILFASILCTCPNQRNLCTLIVSVIVGFGTFRLECYETLNTVNWQILCNKWKYVNSLICNVGGF